MERDERQPTTSALKAIIEAHEATIADLQRRSAALTAELEAQRTTTSALEATIAANYAAIKTRDGTIRDLLDSTSWRVTEPLRVVSRAFQAHSA